MCLNSWSKYTIFLYSAVKTKPVKSERLDTAWLQSEVGKYFNDASSTALGLSLEDLTTTVFDVLTSPKSDTELQNDVSMIFYHIYPMYWDTSTPDHTSPNI